MHANNEKEAEDAVVAYPLRDVFLLFYVLLDLYKHRFFLFLVFWWDFINPLKLIIVSISTTLKSYWCNLVVFHF